MLFSTTQEKNLKKEAKKKQPKVKRMKIKAMWSNPKVATREVWHSHLILSSFDWLPLSPASAVLLKKNEMVSFDCEINSAVLVQIFRSLLHDKYLNSAAPSNCVFSNKIGSHSNLECCIGCWLFVAMYCRFVRQFPIVSRLKLSIQVVT